MNKGRLEAFSDGVLAIIITIMVLEIKLPHGNSDFNSLLPLLPFVSEAIYVLVALMWLVPDLKIERTIENKTTV